MNKNNMGFGVPVTLMSHRYAHARLMKRACKYTCEPCKILGRRVDVLEELLRSEVFRMYSSGQVFAVL